jgi:hypothetical protein
MLKAEKAEKSAIRIPIKVLFIFALCETVVLLLLAGFCWLMP